MNQDNRNGIGLTERDIDTIAGIFKQYPEIMLVHVFGSRAKGNYRLGSDIDLAIMNDVADEQTLRCVAADFEESSLPYKVDIISYQTLKNAELRQHIERVGVMIYKASERSELV